MTKRQTKRISVDDLLSKDDFARLLGISVRELRRLTRAGKLPPHYPITRERLYWCKRDVQRFLESKRRDNDG